ncbi:MAG: PQQ-like beta-propeller repeat protein [Anaerolineaceae bacterium]|nr:PQQ-like beta-propeller repeat protein [Anaerolineaceae bacterium]
MKSRLIGITLIIMIGSIFLSSCMGAIGAVSWPGLSLDQDTETLYVSNSTGVFAIRMQDGNMLKRFPVEPDNKRLFFAPPAVIGDLVVVGDYAGTLSGLDYRLESQGSDALESWNFSDGNGRMIASALGIDELILVPSGNHNLYALDLQGNQQWVFDESEEGLWAQPVSDGEYVYQASMDHNLYAVKVSNGSKEWSIDVGGAVVYSPLLDEDGVLYVVTLADELIAIQTLNQRELWRAETTEEVWGTPVLKDGILFVGDLSGTIYAFEAATGYLEWKVDAGGAVAGSGGITPEGLVFATEEGDVMLVSFDGVKQWTRNVEGKIYGAPAVGTDLVVVALTGGENLLVAFDFNGNQEWIFTPSDK